MYEHYIIFFFLVVVAVIEERKMCLLKEMKLTVTVSYSSYDLNFDN